MTQQAILLVLLPLIAAFTLTPLRRCNPVIARVAGPAVVVSQVMLAITLLLHIAQLGPEAVGFGGFSIPLGIAFHLDLVGMSLVALAGVTLLLLWPWTVESDSAEPSLYLLLLAGASGIALSADLFNLYVFFEVVAVASYGLVAAPNSGIQLYASIRLLLFSAAGSALALLGIGLIYNLGGSLSLAHLGQVAAQDATLFSSVEGLSAFTLILIGLGVKAELFPANHWVPEVYGLSRPRVSGLLAGLVSKLALLILLRLLWQLYTGTGAEVILLVTGLVTLLLGELAAFRATRLREMLAFSSIGQLGLLAVAFSMGNEAGVAAGLLLALNHLLIKPALFLYAHNWRAPITALGGQAWSTPLASALFVLMVLSLMGIPPLPGFWGKYLLLKGVLTAPTLGMGWVVALILFTTLVEMIYFMRLLTRLYAEKSVQPIPPLSRRHYAPVALLGAGLIALTLGMGHVSTHLEQGAAQLLDRSGYRDRLIPASLRHPVNHFQTHLQGTARQGGHP